jgi:hypothetical protein
MEAISSSKDICSYMSHTVKIGNLATEGSVEHIASIFKTLA